MSATAVADIIGVLPPSRVACIVPFLNEELYLPSVLASIESQTLAKGRLFLVAVDNASTDDGPGVIARWLERTGIAGCIIVDPVRSIPHALNTGIRAVDAADIVVRLDAHTVYDPEYLATIVHAFETLPDAWSVGGANTPAPGHDFASAFAEALYTNPMGLGPADYRRSGQIRRVADVYLGAWRPGVLQRLGGYDERWRANEDSELAARLNEAGGAVYWVPVRCRRVNNRSPWSIVRQWSKYGYWRAQTLKRHPSAVAPRQVAPALVLLVAFALLVSQFRAVLLVLYALYAAGTVRSRRAGERPAVTAAALVLFPLVHIGFALGTIVGAFSTPSSLRAARPPSHVRDGVPT